MSRYFFHIRDGWSVIRDEEGMEFPNLNAAQIEAHASARDLCAADANNRRNNRARAIEIADWEGNVVGSVAVPMAMH